MTRTCLSHRRSHEVRSFWFRGREHLLGIGRDDAGQVLEVFVDSSKPSNDAADDARDIAVLASLALQHGTPLSALHGAVTRLANGEPAGPAGAVLDLLTEPQP